MADFDIRVAARESWTVDFSGSEGVQFNGPIMQESISRMVDCAERSACMQDGTFSANETCVETYEQYLAPNGFGIRVRSAGGSYPESGGRTRARSRARSEGGGRWLP
jgi:hypothetical protein